MAIPDIKIRVNLEDVPKVGCKLEPGEQKLLEKAAAIQKGEFEIAERMAGLWGNDLRRGLIDAEEIVKRMGIAQEPAREAGAEMGKLSADHRWSPWPEVKITQGSPNTVREDPCSPIFGRIYADGKPCELPNIEFGSNSTYISRGDTKMAHLCEQKDGLYCGFVVDSRTHEIFVTGPFVAANNEMARMKAFILSSKSADDLDFYDIVIELLGNVRRKEAKHDPAKE